MSDGSGAWLPRRFAYLLPTLAVATAVATYFLVILGSTVRVTESGMGCPGWPLCYGQVGPIDNFHSVMEQSHRYLVAVVTVLVVLTVLAAWRWGRGRRSVLVPALAALVIIAVQIVLGAVTVLTHNAPVTVALHLLTAMVLLGVVWVTAVTSLVDHRQALGRRLTRWGGAAVAMTFLVMISGSLVVDGGAAYACPSWPGCSSIPGVAGPLVLIQGSHRLVVLLATIAIAVFVMHAVRRWRQIRAARPLADLVTVLLLAQIAVGGLVATLSAAPALQDLHLALGSATWAAVVALAALGWELAADSPGGLPARASERGLLGAMNPLPPPAGPSSGAA